MRFPRLRLHKTPAKKPVRTYAIGDIHGCADLFSELLGLIEQDVAQRCAMANRLVILGDFIDRGNQTARIASALMRLDDNPHVIVLKGNHEAVMIDALDGDATAMDAWLDVGGRETLESFGVSVDDDARCDLRALTVTARAAIPTHVLDWLRRRPVSFYSDGYFFVHAGVRPGVALAKQTDEDMLWIRDAFTSSSEDHGAIVVHGHTICENGVEIAPNRIGVDTGAYRTGRLSALGIEGDKLWTITTGTSPRAKSIGAASEQDRRNGACDDHQVTA